MNKKTNIQTQGAEKNIKVPNSNGMNVLMLSIDKEILKDGGPVQKRMEFISGAADTLHILVLGSENKITNTVSEKLIVQGIPVLHKIFIPVYAYLSAKKIVAEDWIVTTQDEFIGIAGYLLKRLKGIPWEAQVHTDIAAREYKTFSLQNRIRTSIARRIYPRATRIRAVSVRVKKSLQQWKNMFVVPIDILPVFIDTSKFYKNTNRGDNVFRVISVSRLSSEKRIDGILCAFAVFHKEHKDTELLIVGDGVERANLEALAHKLQITNAVEFVGQVDNVEDYYADADVYVLNSAYESYGRTIVEAMASGLPVISTDVGIAREFIEKVSTGEVVDSIEEMEISLERSYEEIGRNAHIKEGVNNQLKLEIFSREGYLGALRSNWERVVGSLRSCKDSRQ